MIDTHLHILPGVDDGPKTLDEALALAGALVQAGVSTAVATPHSNDLFPQRSAAEIRGRVSDLQRVLDERHIPLRLLPGHEALIRPGLVEDIAAGRLATLNGSRYLLLELWNTSWLPETERGIFELRAAGIVPVIAHPERYRAVHEHPERLLGLLEQGALVQITAASLLGMQGKTARRCAEDLLKKGCVSCIASDAHHPGRRLAALAELPRLLGPARARQFCEDTPLALVRNEETRGREERRW